MANLLPLPTDSVDKTKFWNVGYIYFNERLLSKVVKLCFIQEGDAIDAELDKQEILLATEGELCGEELLIAHYSTVL